MRRMKKVKMMLEDLAVKEALEAAAVRVMNNSIKE
jgi:hypothetical protein